MTSRVLCAIATFALATLGIGVSTAQAELDIDIFGGVSWTNSTDVAVDGISLFVEYRYSFFPDFELRDKSGLHFKTDLDTNNFVGGLSLRF